MQDLFHYYLLFVYLSQKNIEIDNKEEADFLKSKLCDLLKEFKAKKSDKAEVSVNYCNLPPVFIFNLVANWKLTKKHLSFVVENLQKIIHLQRIQQLESG